MTVVQHGRRALRSARQRHLTATQHFGCHADGRFVDRATDVTHACHCWAPTGNDFEIRSVRVDLDGPSIAAERARVRNREVTVRALLLDPDGEAARRRATEIGENHPSFAAGVRLSLELLADLANDGATIEGYVYDLLPTWRVISLDDTLFVSAFGEVHEGHTSPMYQLGPSPHGAFWRGIRRFTDELRRTARRVI